MDWYQSWLRVYGAFPAIAPILLLIDAPHGRFNYTNGPYGENAPKGLVQWIWSSFNVNGTAAWIVMELPSPLLLLWAYNAVYPITSPSHYGPRLLVGIYLVHYTNRALVSPLRARSRSPSHIIVLLAGIGFNTLNASLIGTYLGTIAKAFGTTSVQLSSGFWLGVLGALVGLTSNIWHDEILLRLRKNPPGNSANWQNHQGKGPRYSVPYGGLYRYISFPNYLSEWFEWACFAASASIMASSLPMSSIHRNSLLSQLGLGISGWYTPPWMFVAAEIAAMFPRAIRGHQWYHEKFGNLYPKERKIVIPFLI